MRLFLALLLCIASLAATADEIGDALRAGGVAFLMRHATAPGNYDPEGFRLDDCATQRNLSEEGRGEARRVGAHLKGLGLGAAEVLTSQWCRCRDTARLAFGGATDWPALNSFARERAGGAAQVATVARRIAGLKRGDRPLVLVTHQVVITALTDIFPQSGEVIVVAPDQRAGRPGVRVIARIAPPP